MPDLDRLEQLARLRDSGTLTQEEFLSAKHALLRPERQRPAGALVAAIIGALVVVALGVAWAIINSGRSSATTTLVTNENAKQNAIDVQVADTSSLQSAVTPPRVSNLIDEQTKFTKVGQCKETQVAVIGNRLGDAPESGSAVTYTDGTFGVSYETVNEVEGSRPGDQVRLCLVERPKDCPPDSDPEQGSVFSAENSRTGGTWSLPNSSHQCGGA